MTPRTRKVLKSLFWSALLPVIVGFILATVVQDHVRVSWHSSCDPGQYYDPTHQICQGSPPAYPRPGYGHPPSNNPNPPLPPGSRQYPY